VSSSDQDQQLEAYALARAAVTGIEPDAAWWPEILRHLRVLCDQAALVERHPGSREQPPAQRCEP
jgi:hypothetical protein